MIEVKQVTKLREFIRFPWKVYKSDPNWVPPLLMERTEFLDPKKNPFFDHAEVAHFMAYENGVAQGRISAIINHAHNVFHEDIIGFFGMFECMENYPAAEALLNAARNFVKSKGMDTFRGPVNLSTNDDCGLLIDSFDQPAQIMMTYNPSYYIKFFEQFGLQKSKDLLAYRIDVPKEAPERLKRGAELITKRGGFTVRCANMKDFKGEVARIKEIYNDAWERNWGFIPMTDREFDHLGAQLKQILDPDFLFIAEKNGEPIGFSLVIPNINEALQKIKNGRLLPFGLITLLLNTRSGAIKSLRVITLGLKKNYRSFGIDAVFYYKCFETAMRKNYKWAEMSWILEDNMAMNRPLENMGAKVYKRYRLYDKTI